MGRLADAFFRAQRSRTARERAELEQKRFALEKKMAKSKQEIQKLKIQEITQQLAAQQVKQKATGRLLKPDSSPTVNTPEGPPRPDQQGVLARLAQGQTNTIRDAVLSGSLGELQNIQKVQAFRTPEQALANVQKSGILGGGQQGPEFIKRKTILNPGTGSLSLQFEQARPIVRDLDENALAVISPITGEMVGTIEKSSPKRRRTLQEQQFIPEKELADIVFVDPKKRTVSPAPFNLRRGDLNDKDFVRVNPAQKKQLAALSSALGMLEQLSGSVDKVFTAQAGLLERGVAGGQNVWEQIIQNNPALTIYSSQSQGFVSRLARALGEVGTLTDQDAARALKLLPRIRNIFGLPDTADIAQAKMEAFTTLLQSQYNQILGKNVFDVKTPIFDKLIKDAPDDGLFQQGREAVGTAERGLAGEAKSVLDKGWESFKKRFNLQDSQ